MRDAFPDGPEDVRVEWLSAVLRDQNAIADASVRSLRFTPLQEGRGGNGEIVRFTLNYDRQEDGAPRSLIGKFSSPDPEIRDVIRKLGVYERETQFYAAIAGRSEFPIPRCYFSAFDPDTQSSLLLLEDLGHLHRTDTVTGVGSREVDNVIQGIAAFHARWWGQTRQGAMAWLPSFLEIAGLFSDLYTEAWAAFLRQVETVLPDYQLSPAFLSVGHSLENRIHELCEPLAGPPSTCIHCDMHLENLLFGASPTDPPFKIVDWQIAAAGKGVVDVAYYLIRSIPADQLRQSEASLLQTYHGLLVEYGVSGYTFDECWLDYRRAAIWPFLTITISAGLGDRSFVENPARFETTLGRLDSFIQDHGVAELVAL